MREGDGNVHRPRMPSNTKTFHRTHSRNRTQQSPTRPTVEMRGEHLLRANRFADGVSPCLKCGGTTPNAMHQTTAGPKTLAAPNRHVRSFDVRSGRSFGSHGRWKNIPNAGIARAICHLCLKWGAGTKRQTAQSQTESDVSMCSGGWFVMSDLAENPSLAHMSCVFMHLLTYTDRVNMTECNEEKCAIHYR